MKNIRKILYFIIFFLITTNSISFAEDTSSICADRPGKTTPTCTVPQGHFQIEADGYNGIFTKQDGVKTSSTVMLDPTVKYGLTNNLDIEMTLTPYLHVKSSGFNENGIGDTYFKLKYNFLKTDKISMAVIPIVKAPTARKTLGNGVWEGGVQFPISYNIDDKWSIGSTPEIDFVKNTNNDNHHLATQQTISINRMLPYGLTLSGELWLSRDYDIKETRLYSTDFSLAWVHDPNTQFDVGVNFGMNKQAGNQFYFGISKRF